MTPNMVEGEAIARKEMPNMAPVKPYGFFSRLLGPSGALGYTSPGGGIYMNPATNQGQSPQEIADTLTHEQEHVNQQQQSPYGPTRKFLNDAFSMEPYQQRNDELGAYQAESQRRARMGRMPTPVPNFDTGEMYVPRGDINLPLPKKRL